jgi:hypothetical protein
MLNVVPNPASQSLGNSRDLVKNNFGDIDTTFTVNHVQYNDGGGLGGLHNVLQMPANHTTYPLPATAAGQAAIYVNNGSFSGQPEAFFQRQSQSAGTGYSFTEAGATNPGWTRLPSGILLKWQSGVSFGGSNSKTINLNGIGVGPNFATTLTILITPIATSNFDHVIAISNITFPSFTVSTMNGSSAPSSLTYSYLVIGT